MKLLDRLIVNKPLLDLLLTSTDYRESLGFGDLLWSEANPISRLLAWSDPGVCFQTPERLVVVEEWEGELRFYAGGSGTQVYNQPNELGVFHSAEDILTYAEAFLIR